MSKESEALNYLVSLAVAGNRENHRGKIFESQDIIKNALKRNEPMKVDLETKYTLPYSGTYYECPRCGKRVMRKYNYCPDCGKALDWSDDK